MLQQTFKGEDLGLYGISFDKPINDTVVDPGEFFLGQVCFHANCIKYDAQEVQAGVRLTTFLDGYEDVQ